MTTPQEASDDSEFVQFCIQCASLTLLYYDYLLTFPLELQYMWRKRVMLSTILYWFCRYALLANLFYLLAISNAVNKMILCSVLVARTYAVCDRSRVILLVMGILWILIVAFDFWHTTGTTCGELVPPNIVIASTALSVLVAVLECAGALFTTIRCMQAMQLYKKHDRAFTDDNILHFMLREGSIYFFGVFGFSLATILLNFIGFMKKLLNALNLPVSGIMAARLLLYLRQYNHHQQEWAMKHSRGSPNHVNTTIVVHQEAGSNASPEYDGIMQSNDRIQSIFVPTNSHTYADGEFGGDPVASVRVGHPEMSVGRKDMPEETVSSRRLPCQDDDSLIITEERRPRPDAEAQLEDISDSTSGSSKGSDMSTSEKCFAQQKVITLKILQVVHTILKPRNAVHVAKWSNTLDHSILVMQTEETLTPTIHCTAVYQVAGYLSIAGRAAVLVSLAIRTYAVWNGSRIIAIMMGVMWTITTSLDFWHVTGDNCDGTVSSDIAVANAAVSIAVVSFEGMGMTLTVIRYLQAHFIRGRYIKPLKGESLLGLLVREDPVYLARLLNAVTLPLSGLLTARLLLHLRREARRLDSGMTRGNVAEDIDTNVSISAPVFARFRISESITSTSRSDGCAGRGEFGGDPVARVRVEVEQARLLPTIPETRT
ncbi:hypothetical protein CONPUDRAFT_69652 [Coniophora puteana RWD-64-598 SS2]|uniref:DUF6533 domain-containing protein n=1 Tax=Coniophora puteana (strain RWD-64-598) TaxID=741705 RepID=A0A5M3N9K7_CONPW|nr:uncharacterized protein CONPUDRAFT_69652 [Coniophora puteana RWD-64-598 SS2]EIW87445.1 hypothetical protein CONPUDRAFT_69652 [Coniophora puteana RWD-64-598 SS2]